ncbi:OmpA family protein [Rheinheimera pacifica]|uniref:OmpA family protein n=1 Tax=Rheinheimera pacifica TaxID=173990 RepID=A0A1H6KYA8_9GAMM|nr:OmpA family protein [Rheinheimera pacifica]SEH80933.1 OmpA family protein [Rheinheimera pacifica]
MHYLILSLLFVTSFSLLAKSDHPLVSDYPGASIYHHAVSNYTDVVIPQHKVTNDKAFSGVTVTGKQTGHIYRIQGEHSALHIAENYLDVVKRLNAKLLLLCRSDCGRSFSTKLIHELHWSSSIFGNLSDFSSFDKEHYYILAQLGPDDAPTYLQWFIKQASGDTVELGQIITEPQQLQLGLVKVFEDAITPEPMPSPAATSLGPDQAKGGDHPLISRYSGAKLTHSKVTEHTEVRLATGIADEHRQVPQLVLAGKSTLLHYEASKDQSTLQIFRNYQQALENAGFKLIFSCEHQACGDNQLALLWQGSPERNRFKGYLTNSNSARDDYRMLTAYKTVHEQDIYLSVAVKKHNEYSNVDIAHDIIELSTIQTNRVSIDTAYLQNELSRSGKVVLHGLHFASDSATLLPESADSLKVIAAYLTQHAEQAFYVVGHTDNSGSHSHNIQLSKARADSILQALVKQGIKADRLLAEGVGAMSPQQHNGNAGGKAINRRVELVLR